MHKRRPTAEELIAQAEANGYKRGAHTERDQVRGQEKHVKKTKKDQDATLGRYVLWHLAEAQRGNEHRGLTSPTEEEMRKSCLHPGVSAPDLAPDTIGQLSFDGSESRRQSRDGDEK